MATVMAMDDALTVTGGREGQRDRESGRRVWQRIQSSFLSPFLPRFAVFFHCLAVAVAVPPPWPVIIHGHRLHESRKSVP